MVKDDCIFCKLANGVFPVNAVYEDEMVKVILDRGPATKGHALIIPKSHADNLYDLDDEVAARITVVAKKVATAMKAAFKLEGLNVVQNNGEIAGQTVMHYHTHIIPRYENDSVKVTWNPGEITDETVDSLVEAIKKEM